jgi:hypothetical protein
MGDHRPAAVVGLDQAAGLQRPGRLTDRQPAHLEARRQLRFRRERGPWLELTEHQVLQSPHHGVRDADRLGVLHGLSMRHRGRQDKNSSDEFPRITLETWLIQDEAPGSACVLV